MNGTIVRVDFATRRVLPSEQDEATARAEAASTEVLDWCESHGVPRAMALIQANAAARTVRAGFDHVGAARRACDRATRGSHPPSAA